MRKPTPIEAHARLSALAEIEFRLTRARTLDAGQFPGLGAKIRSAIASAQGVRRNAERFAATDRSYQDADGTLTFTKANVGEYWTSGPYGISTVRMGGAHVYGGAALRGRRAWQARLPEARKYSGRPAGQPSAPAPYSA
jgi:hypothetical protein